MKTIRNHSPVPAANVLVVTLIMCALMGMVLLAYMQLIQGRTKVRARSLSWNAAIPVLESGIEEALSHLHQDGTNLTANSWTKGGTNSAVTYQKSRTNSDGSFCSVTISNVATTPINAPIIYSQGFVPAPLQQGYISRLVQVCTTNPAVYSKAIAARGLVSLSGGSIVDSFDSSNTNYSTGGKYDPAKRRANGGIVTGAKTHPAVTLSSGHIYGTVDTGAGGTVTTSGSGGVGDLASGPGIENGYTNDDFNFTYPDPTPPTNYASWTAPASGTYTYAGTNNYTYLLGSNTYYSPLAVSLQGSSSMVVTGAATWYVGGNFTVGGSAFIYIAPGGSLTLYCAGTTTTLSGGGVANGTGNAANFSYIGLTNNTSITYSGSSGFTGTMNAPRADFTISGAAAVTGAMIVNSVNDSGGAAIHYDEGLGALGGFVLLSYREL